MFMLTRDDFIKARSYIYNKGTDIDRAWFRYNFEDASETEFLRVLSRHQHKNGGFGGLYHEFAYQGPCLKSTEIAIQYIFGLKHRPSADLPIIRNTIKYLLDTYLAGRGSWGEVVVPEVNESAHCYWARWRGENISPIENEDERIQKYDANEKACFAAFISYYSELVPKELCDEILKYPVQHILRYYDINSADYNATLFDKDCPYPFEYLTAFVPWLKDKDLVKKLSDILCQNPTAFMELDFERSDIDYVHLPCDWAVKSPNSILYPTVKDLVDKSLDYRLKQQSADGKWPLGWSFGNDADMQKLQLKYETYMTLEMLVKLKNFGRIEV